VHHPLRVTGLALTAGAVIATALAAVPAAADSDTTDGSDATTVEVFSQDGSITRTEVATPLARARSFAATPTAEATLTPVEIHGPSENRIDLVFLGDGYTADEQDLYDEQMKAAWELLSEREPFHTYRDLFNVWSINITSPVSGVSGDPTADVVKDTPLGTYYYCNNLDRLICADVDAVKQYASLAPEADQIGVVVNSSTYGGAGYTSDEMVTFSGGNASGPEILSHELGHSIGDLADEYPYYAYPGDGSEWVWDEPVEANASTYDAATMTADHLKWWRWLGEPSPDGGVTDTYEGAYYTELGVYRPSENSLMRSLGREFNLPSREKMVQSFYTFTGLIDAHTANDTAVKAKSTLTVSAVPIDTVKIRWYVDGKEYKPWRGKSTVRINTVSNGHGKGAHSNGGVDVRTVKAVVTDTTSWVRDPEFRADYLTDSVTWTVAPEPHKKR